MKGKNPAVLAGAIILAMLALMGATTVVNLATQTVGLLSASHGGTGIDSSSSTGFPQLSGGTWSITSALNAQANTFVVKSIWCGGIKAEGLAGTPGWFTDLPGATPGTITGAPSATTPDANHPCPIVLTTSAVSGDEVGIGMAPCYDTTPSTACSNGGFNVFPAPSSAAFTDQLWVFQEPAAITNVGMCVWVSELASFDGTRCPDINLASPPSSGFTHGGYGVRFDTNAGDSHFKGFTCPGGSTACTTADLGVGPIASDWACVLVRNPVAGTLFFSIGQDATSCLGHLGSESSISTNVPTFAGGPWFQLKTYNTTAKAISPVLHIWIQPVAP